MNGSSECVNSVSIDPQIKRKFLPWTSRLCGGPNNNGMSLCSYEPDEHGLRKCFCSTSPDQNYILCHNLVIMLFDNGLHVCDKDVGTTWSILTSKFCIHLYISSYDPVQGPAAKKSFHGIVKKARILLSNQSSTDSFTPFEMLMKVIINEIDGFLKQRTEMLQQKMSFEAEKIASMQMALADQTTCHSCVRNDDKMSINENMMEFDNRSGRKRPFFILLQASNRIPYAITLSNFEDTLSKRMRSASSTDFPNKAVTISSNSSYNAVNDRMQRA